VDDKRSFGRWRVTDVTGFEMSKKVEAELVLEADGLVLRRDDGHRDLFPYPEVFARTDDSTKTVLITATGRVWLQARGAARNDGLQEELTVRRKAADPEWAGPLEGRPVPSGNAPAPARLATVGLCLFVIGLAIGVFQPLFVVGIGAGLVAGPTYAGLLFLLCIPIALVMLVLAFVGARWVTVPAFVGSAALAVGLLAGISTANALSSRSAASRPVTPTPAGTMQSFPTSLEAHADVTLILDPASGFTSNPTTGGPDGTFGHWCYSLSGSTDILEVTAMDVVSAGTSTLLADLYLEDTPARSTMGTRWSTRASCSSCANRQGSPSFSGADR
jgi:energy-converting hydrogenase Eha subunit B